MTFSLSLGIFGFITPMVGLTMRRPFPSMEALLQAMLSRGLNTAAVTFWIAFPILYCIRVPKSTAALDWDRRMKMAEEIFKRERALGRGSWWM